MRNKKIFFVAACGIVLFSLGSASAQYVIDPTNTGSAGCPTTQYGSTVTCSSAMNDPDGRLCGGDTACCIVTDGTSLKPIAGVSATTTSASSTTTPYAGGGFYYNCRGADTTVQFDNWTCFPNSTCYGAPYHVVTQCTAGVSGASTCTQTDTFTGTETVASKTNCISGWQNCDTDNTNCEVNYGVTQSVAWHYKDGVCDGAGAGVKECDSGYLDCNGNTSGDGKTPTDSNCEIQIGGDCTASGGIAGKYASTCDWTKSPNHEPACIANPVDVWTGGSSTDGTLTTWTSGASAYSSENPILWAKQLGTGDLAKLITPSGQEFRVDNDGCIWFPGDKGPMCNPSGGAATVKDACNVGDDLAGNGSYPLPSPTTAVNNDYSIAQYFKSGTDKYDLDKIRVKMKRVCVGAGCSDGASEVGKITVALYQGTATTGPVTLLGETTSNLTGNGELLGNGAAEWLDFYFSGIQIDQNTGYVIVVKAITPDPENNRVELIYADVAQCTLYQGIQDTADFLSWTNVTPAGVVMFELHRTSLDGLWTQMSDYIKRVGKVGADKYCDANGENCKTILEMGATSERLRDKCDEAIADPAGTISTATQKLAQVFTAIRNYELKTVSLRVAQGDSNPGNVLVSLVQWDTPNNVPLSPALASVEINAGEFSILSVDGASFRAMSFPTAVNITGGLTYAIILEPSTNGSTVGVGSEIYWAKSADDVCSTPANAAWAFDTTWAVLDPAADFMFRTYSMEEGVTFEGVTKAKTNGNLPGYKGGDEICGVDFPGSRMCSDADMLYVIGSTADPSSFIEWDGAAWINTGGAKSSSDTVPVNDCNGWTYDGTTITNIENSLGSVWIFSGLNYNSTNKTGRGGVVNCQEELPIACCKGHGGGGGTGSSEQSTVLNTPPSSTGTNLPDQNGQTGKFLTTDGSSTDGVLSWGSPLPPFSLGLLGSPKRYLTQKGTLLSGVSDPYWDMAIPDITSTDNGKFLKANYSLFGFDKSYSWASILPAYTSLDVGKVLGVTSGPSYGWVSSPSYWVKESLTDNISYSSGNVSVTGSNKMIAPQYCLGSTNCVATWPEVSGWTRSGTSDSSTLGNVGIGITPQSEKFTVKACYGSVCGTTKVGFKTSQGVLLEQQATTDFSNTPSGTIFNQKNSAGRVTFGINSYNNFDGTSWATMGAPLDGQSGVLYVSGNPITFLSTNAGGDLPTAWFSGSQIRSGTTYQGTGQEFTMNGNIIIKGTTTTLGESDGKAHLQIEARNGYEIQFTGSGDSNIYSPGGDMYLLAGAGGNGDNVILGGGGQNTIFVVTKNSGIMYGSGGFITASDRRLKENIKPLMGSLEKVKQLQGVSFDWKIDGKNSMGFIAQDVEKIFPDAVRSGDSEDEMKTLNYDMLIAPLLEAVKEQQTEIDELRARVEVLEKQ